MFELPMTMTFFLLRPSDCPSLSPFTCSQSEQCFQHGLFNCFVFGFCVVALCLTWPGPAWPGPMVVRLSHCRFLHNKTTKLTVKCWSASHPPRHSPSLAPTVLCAVLPGKYLIWSKGFSCLSFSFVFFCFFPVLPLSTFL